ncbi:MAG: arginase family protein [Acidobacteria bacterium]|nr:arginase family protein [Acidobacteriota bacterium]
MFQIIEVPFHLGLEEVAVGKGPARLLRAGADQLLATRGMPAAVTHVRPRDLRGKGLDLVVDVNRVLRAAVKEAAEQETTPVVLAGNCNSCLGTLAGLDAHRLGIVWLDKHPDLNTPDTSISGLLEGMSLAAALGHCHQELRERIGLPSPVAEQNVVLAGIRDIDPGEKERLEDSWISVHPFDSLGLLPGALRQLRERVDGVYFHIDTDFLDCAEKPYDMVRLVRESAPLKAIAITNYNPDLDRGATREREILGLLSALQ